MPKIKKNRFFKTFSNKKYINIYTISFSLDNDVWERRNVVYIYIYFLTAF